MKRHACLLTYLLYIALFILYFIPVGKILFSLPLGLESELLLELSLLLSFVLAVLTALLVMNWKKLVKLFRNK